MILYNVTISIDENVEQKWLQWMKNTHIPDVMKTNCFIECKLSKINGEEEGGKTYAIMYTCESEEKMELYQTKFSSALQEDHSRLFSGKFAAFRTFLDVIETFDGKS